MVRCRLASQVAAPADVFELRQRGAQRPPLLLHSPQQPAQGNAAYAYGQRHADQDEAAFHEGGRLPPPEWRIGGRPFKFHRARTYKLAGKKPGLTQCVTRKAHTPSLSPVWCPLIIPRGVSAYYTPRILYRRSGDHCRSTVLVSRGRLHPLRRAARAPFAATTCAPSVPHGSVGSMRASGACSACTSLIFVRCASPLGRNSLRHPTSPIMSRTGPTRFDARSSRGGRPERALGEHPHVLGGRVVCRKGVQCTSCPSCPRPHPHAPAPSGCARGGCAGSGGTPPQSH